ncbi:MAG: hypothetical protein AAFN10_11070 [Bacteroidota bacterium]
MTIEQKEQAILTMLREIPLFRRVRIPIQIMQGVSPEQVVFEGNANESEALHMGDQAASILESRITAFENGDVKAKDAKQSLEDLRAD